MFHTLTKNIHFCHMATENLGQHWLRQWLVAWGHDAIAWTYIDWSSVKSSDIKIRAISQEIPQPAITKIHMKIT